MDNYNNIVKEFGDHILEHDGEESEIFQKIHLYLVPKVDIVIMEENVGSFFALAPYVYF